MRNLFLILALAFLTACGTQSGNETINQGNGNETGQGDSSNLNTFVSGTLFDSLPVENTPYVDSIALEEFSPLRKVSLSTAQINFLKIRDIRAFRQYDWPMPDSAFSAVCRLKLSPEYYSVIINYDGQNETMNYLINYDRHYQVIDYLETAYDELVESMLRTSARIDTTAVTVRFADFLSSPQSVQEYTYTISADGFFREMIAQQ